MLIKNILCNSLRQENMRVILSKIFKRFERNTSAEALVWAKNNAMSIESYCSRVNTKLWHETIEVVSYIEISAKKVLCSMNVDFGGGGAYPLLYFLIRNNKPKVVVETGVAAGWSSLTILEALARNDHGVLYSSDFPYFRLENPEKYIGILVPEALRKNWILDIRGDVVALESIAKRVETIDFFHYDSDKSYSGRKSALKIIRNKLGNDSIFVMDDIQDNIFFKTLVETSGYRYFVFEFNGKYVGLIQQGF